MDKKQLLKLEKLKIFSGIGEPAIIEILNALDSRNFSAGETIIQQGEHPNGEGYVIEEGSVDIFINDVKTAELSAGDIFGEFALLNEEARSATAIAKTDIKALIISQEILIEMINNDVNNINKEIIRRMEENLERADDIDESLVAELRN